MESQKICVVYDVYKTARTDRTSRRQPFPGWVAGRYPAGTVDLEVGPTGL